MFFLLDMCASILSYTPHTKLYTHPHSTIKASGSLNSGSVSTISDISIQPPPAGRPVAFITKGKGNHFKPHQEVLIKSSSRTRAGSGNENLPDLGKTGEKCCFWDGGGVFFYLGKKIKMEITIDESITTDYCFYRICWGTAEVTNYSTHQFHNA